MCGVSAAGLDRDAFGEENGLPRRSVMWGLSVLPSVTFSEKL